MSRLAGVFERLRAARRPGLVAYVTAGDPDAARSENVGVHVVPDVDDRLGRDARTPERPLEDGGVRLLVADARAGGDEVEVANEVERVEQLRQVPDPVAHGSHDQPPLT